jgi:hypothetical protein
VKTAQTDTLDEFIELVCRDTTLVREYERIEETAEQLADYFINPEESEAEGEGKVLLERLAKEVGGADPLYLHRYLIARHKDLAEFFADMTGLVTRS